MTCFRPLKTYRPAKDDEVRRSDAGMMPTLIPCGNCDGCRLGRAQMWSNRMFWETDYWPSTIFGTFTLENEGDGSVHKEHLQLFFKRLRKKTPCRYYACGEYGETRGRPHYHAVIFGLSCEQHEDIQKIWGLGDVLVSPFLRERALYTAGYMLKNVRKDIDLTGRNKPFAVMSQGIGERFALANREKIEQRELTIYGKKVGTPRYYRTSLGIQQIESDYEGEIYEKHAMRLNAYGPKDQPKILESIEESRHQAELTWKADFELRRHENAL